MSEQPARHIVTISGASGTRQVHYRRCGQGPLVLLLHQSPQSSREMVSLMRAWSGAFTLVAPDTPGYGLSDPLPDPGQGLAAFARATLEFADAIGAGRFGIYGYHTGSSIGMALAARAPARVAALACNGLILPDPAERADLLEHYLPPLVPRWDGGHLAWAWARLREQTLFFPWYRGETAARLHYDVPAPECLQENLLELLGAGDNYATAYRGAFVHDSRADLAHLAVPALVIASAHDPLAAHIPRLGDSPACLLPETAADPAAALEGALALLAAHPGDPLGPAPETGAATTRPWRELVPDGHGGQTCLLHAGPAAGTPLLLLHGPGTDAGLALAEAGSASEAVHLVLPELPGHGASDPLPEHCDDSIEATLATLELLLRRHGPIASAGLDAGGLLLTAAARRAGGRPPVLLLDPPLWNAEGRADWRAGGLPGLLPDWHGGHLSECWHLVRDSALFFPWYLRSREAILGQVAGLDDRLLHQRAVALLRANGHWQALLDGLLARDWRDFTGPHPQPRLDFSTARASAAGRRMHEGPGPFQPVQPAGAALAALLGDLA